MPDIKESGAIPPALFRDGHPAEKIRWAIEDTAGIRKLRQEYLDTVKVRKEIMEKKSRVLDDPARIAMLSAGLPVSIVGYALMEKFQAPGMAVCITGLTAFVCALLSGLYRGWYLREMLGAINDAIKELLCQIERANTYTGEICRESGIPENAPDRLEQLRVLYRTAQEYERSMQRNTDYSLAVCMARAGFPLGDPGAASLPEFREGCSIFPDRANQKEAGKETSGIRKENRRGGLPEGSRKSCSTC